MLKKIGILLLLLVMFAVPASANEYIEEAYGIFVEKMEMVEENQERKIVITFGNYSSHPISEFVLEVVMLDNNYQPVLAFSPDMDGFFKELRVCSVKNPLVFKTPLESKKRSSFTVLVPKEYKDASIARAAVSYYKRATGEEFYVSPSVMLWNHTDGTKRSPAPGGTYYPGLTAQEKELSASFTLGVTIDFSVLSEEMAPYYNKSHGGLWVIEIAPGSLAEKLGLQKDDLLVSVDGIALAEDLRALELGKAKMANGETIVFSWLRGNELMAGTLKKD